MLCPSHLVIHPTVYSILSGGDSRSSAQVQCYFPIVIFLSKASLTKQPSTFLVATLLFFAGEQPTVPHMKEEDKTSLMNPITLISKMKQCSFQTNYIANQPARWIQNVICGSLNDIKCVTDITKCS